MRLVTVTGDAVVNNILITGNTGFRGNTGTEQLTAVARSGLNNPLPAATITWATNAASVGTVSGTGLVTFAGGNDTLRITATATAQGLAGSSPNSVAGFRVVTRLRNGEPRNVPTIAGGAFFDYTVFATGLPSFTVTQAGGTGDLDLYLYNPGVTAFSATDAGGSGYVCRPWFDGNNEACNVAAPLAGWYRVRAYAWTPAGAVTGATMTLTHP